MKIHTLWGLRKGFEQDAPELMVAWDYYSVDNNYEGWVEDCDKAIKSWGGDLLVHRYVDFDVDERKLLESFEVPTIGVPASSVEFPRTEHSDG